MSEIDRLVRRGLSDYGGVSVGSVEEAVKVETFVELIELVRSGVGLEEVELVLMHMYNLNHVVVWIYARVLSGGYDCSRRE